MKKIFLMSGLVTMMSLGAIPSVQAKPLENSTEPANPQSSYLIASPFRAEISPAHQKRTQLMKMLVLQMEMNDLAEEAMASEDPELRAMATEMMKSGVAMTDQLLELIQRSPRSGQFSR